MPGAATPVTRADVCMLFAKSAILQQWHWFTYHFGTLNVPGWEHPLAASIIDALVHCDRAMPGYAETFVTRFASTGGKEKHLPHYEQLLQQLAELHVVRQVVSFDWPGSVEFAAEPMAQASRKNPEITVRHEGIIYGIEVKAPALHAHNKARNTNSTQVPARLFTPEMLARLKRNNESLTLPRDNPVKDFLRSADKKFAAFKREVDNFVGILVIVWDDHVYEPISSLFHESSGLLTPNSFDKDATGAPIPYTNVDGVFVLRHLHQLARAAGDQPLIDGCAHALDYGKDGEFPFKIFAQNSNAREVPEIIQRCLQGLPAHPEMGAEYTPKDLVWWITPESPTT
jgi:hypothetical protein